MEIPIDRIGDIMVASVPIEELEASNAAEFKQDIALLLDSTSRLALDLGNLQFVDSSGLGAFISCLRKLNAKGGDLKLYNMSKQVRSVFELVRMDRVFDIFATKDEAVRALGS